MIKKYRFHLFTLFICGAVIFAGCSGSSSTETEEETSNPEVSYKETHGAIILNAAEEEQQNDMYTKANDDTYLYWLDNMKIHLRNRTKCNIYAMNADSSKFTDILPVVGISDPESARKGDLIAWNGHVIIFDYLVRIKRDIYAMAWWSGTGQKDNGDNIINNVCHGKYKLNGYYVVRRPVKK
jgi:hypothetical protein